jgi:hypothetical protein
MPVRLPLAARRTAPGYLVGSKGGALRDDALEPSRLGIPVRTTWTPEVKQPETIGWGSDPTK